MSDSQRTIEDSPLLYCLHLSTRDRWAHISPLVCLKCYLPVTVLPSPGKTECCLLMPSFFPFITFFFFFAVKYIQLNTYHFGTSQAVPVVKNLPVNTPDVRDSDLIPG